MDDDVGIAAGAGVVQGVQVGVQVRAAACGSTTCARRHSPGCRPAPGRPTAPRRRLRKVFVVLFMSVIPPVAAPVALTEMVRGTRHSGLVEPPRPLRRLDLRGRRSRPRQGAGLLAHDLWLRSSLRGARRVHLATQARAVQDGARNGDGEVGSCAPTACRPPQGDEAPLARQRTAGTSLRWRDGGYGLRAQGGTMPRDRTELTGFVLAVVWLVGVVVLDLATARPTFVLTALLAIAPLIACAVLPVAGTAVFAAAAVGLAVASGAWNETWGRAASHPDRRCDAGQRRRGHGRRGAGAAGGGARPRGRDRRGRTTGGAAHAPGADRRRGRRCPGTCPRPRMQWSAVTCTTATTSTTESAS